MFIAERQSAWPVFRLGPQPLRCNMSGDMLINFFAQRPIQQSSLTVVPMPVRLIDSSTREGPREKSTEKGEENKGKERQTTHALKATLKLA